MNRIFTPDRICGCLVLIILLTGSIKDSQGSDSGLQISELRKSRAGSHLRAVDYSPGGNVAWTAGFNGVVMKTLDGGISWDHLNTETFHRFYGIRAVSDSLVFVCGTGGSVLVTEDGGQLWTSINPPTEKRLVGVWFLNRTRGWVAGDEGLIYSTKDGGESLKAVNFPSFSRIITVKIITASMVKILYT